MRCLDEQETTQVLRGYHLDQPRGPGFAFRDRARNTFYDWHTHAYHQLIYAISGTTQIETERARYLLPAGRAAWIPVATRHRTLITDVDGASLYFAPETVPDPQRRVRILVASPVMREMILHAMRWPLGASEADQVASSFFRTLGLMCSENVLPLSGSARCTREATSMRAVGNARCGRPRGARPAFAPWTRTGASRGTVRSTYSWPNSP